MIRYWYTHQWVFGFIGVLLSVSCRSPEIDYPISDLIARFSSAKIAPLDSVAARITRDGSLLLEAGSSVRYAIPKCTHPILRLRFDTDFGNTALSIQWDDERNATVFNSPDPIEVDIGPQSDSWFIELRTDSARVVLKEARVVDRSRHPVSSGFRDGSTVPNVILIIIDTLRADHLGCYGSIEPRTTALDSLASRGIVYESATSQANGTLPSISSILSGVYPYRHGIYSNDVSLEPHWDTLPEELRRAGYATGAFVGAFHLNPRISGFGRGFDYYGKCSRLERRGKEVVDEALEWLELHRHDRFFSMIHMFDPHTPYLPPKEMRYNYYTGDPRDPEKTSMRHAWFPPAKHDYIQRWLGGITDIEWPLAQYKSEVEYASIQTGRIFDWLRSAGLMDQTLVIVTADHGESLTEHGIFFEHAGLYEEAIHVPLIVSFPGVLPEGIRLNSPVENFSIFPTILRLLNLPFPEAISAATLPLTPEEPATDRIISEAGFEQAIMVRNGIWKYIRNTRPSYFTHYDEELYNLIDDPVEATNRVEKNERPINDLRAVAQGIVEKRKKRRKRADVGLEEDDKARLRALGYVD